MPVKDGKVTSTARIDAALPTLQARARRRRARDGHVAPRTAEGRQARSGRVAEAGRREARRAAWAATCRSPRIGSTASTSSPASSCCARTCASTSARKPTTTRSAKRMAALCDVFVMDAFGTAHRAQASTNGVARHAPRRVRGAAARRRARGARAARSRARSGRLTAIIGGSKVSTKIEVLQSLSTKVDELILGGGIANTILAASGVERRQVAAREGHARVLGEAAARRVRQGEDSAADRRRRGDEPRRRRRKARVKNVRDVAADEMILDIGPETAALYARAARERRHDRLERPARRVRESGVRGRHAPRRGSHRGEQGVLDRGRRRHARGHRAVRRRRQISYISTGGGAFLEFLEGKKLPAVATLEQRAAGG